MLTTTGAKSGLPRTHPLTCLSAPQWPDRVAVVASNYGQKHYPGWYYNLKANPGCSGLLDGIIYDYVAHEADATEYAIYWQLALDVYVGFSQYAKRAGNRRIPIMVLEPMAIE